MQGNFLTTFDPRSKFVSLLLLGTLVTLSQTFAGVTVASLLAVVALAMSPMSVRNMAIRLRSVAWFVLAILAVQVFATSGTVLFEIGGLYATKEGVSAGIALAMKIVLLSFFSMILLSTTRIDEMLDGIETALARFKNSGALFLMLSVTLNFIPLLIRSAQQIKAAQIARGADVDSSFRKQIQFAFSATLPLFVSAFRSAHALADAIDARGFNPGIERTPFRRLHFQRNDWLLLTSLALICGCTLYLEARLNTSLQ